jgi:hypothetical protein
MVGHAHCQATPGRGRTSRRGCLDPNDRHYDSAFEREIKRLDPRDLDRLMTGSNDEPDDIGGH